MLNPIQNYEFLKRTLSTYLPILLLLFATSICVLGMESKDSTNIKDFEKIDTRILLAEQILKNVTDTPAVLVLQDSPGGFTEAMQTILVRDGLTDEIIVIPLRQQSEWDINSFKETHTLYSYNLCYFEDVPKESLYSIGLVDKYSPTPLDLQKRLEESYEKIMQVDMSFIRDTTLWKDMVGISMLMNNTWRPLAEFHPEQADSIILKKIKPWFEYSVLFTGPLIANSLDRGKLFIVGISVIDLLEIMKATIESKPNDPYSEIFKELIPEYEEKIKKLSTEESKP